MPTTTCIAPLADGTTLCGAPSTTTRIVEDLSCALCDEHAAEIDRDTEEDPRVFTYTITDDDLGGPLMTVVDPDRDLSCVLDERISGLSSEVIEHAGSAYIVTTGTGETSYGSDGGACAFAYDADDVRAWLTSTRADETLDYGDLCDALSATNDRDLAIYLAARHEYRLTEEGACVPVLDDAEYDLVRAAVRAMS